MYALILKSISYIVFFLFLVISSILKDITLIPLLEDNSLEIIVKSLYITLNTNSTT